VTLTERRSRLHLIRRVSQRTAEAVSRAIIGQPLVRSTYGAVNIGAGVIVSQVFWHCAITV